MSTKTSNALDILRKRYGSEPGIEERLADERVRAQAAQAIYDARNAAGLTQKQLADLVGTHQSSIARMESGDYEGHSLPMLDKIAHALGQRVEIRFVPAPAVKTPAPKTKTEPRTASRSKKTLTSAAK